MVRILPEVIFQPAEAICGTWEAQWKPPETSLCTGHISSHILLPLQLFIRSSPQAPLLLSGDCCVAAFENVKQKHCLFCAQSNFPAGTQLVGEQLTPSTEIWREGRLLEFGEGVSPQACRGKRCKGQELGNAVKRATRKMKSGRGQSLSAA